MTRARFGRCGFWAAAVLLGMWPAPAAGQDTRVTIESRYVADDHEYTYRVTNRHSSPVVEIEIPHFKADLVTAPDDWGVELTNRVGAAGGGKPGVCKVKPKNGGGGLVAGQVVQFQMRVPDAAVAKGANDARVRFADGTEAIVPNVTVPIPPSGGGGVVLPVGLVVIFVAAVVFREYRRRQRSGAAAPPGESDRG